MNKIKLIALALAVLLTLALTGCAYISSKTYDPTTGKISTKMRGYAFWDSTGTIQKFSNRASAVQSNEWAAGTYIGGAQGSSTSTNVNDLIGTIVGAAVSAAAKSAKP